MIGVVLLAALLLLVLAIYVAARRKPGSEELRGNDQTEADHATIESRGPGDAAFDAAFAKHRLSQSNGSTDRNLVISSAG
jgi:hypothetical protein